MKCLWQEGRITLIQYLKEITEKKTLNGAFVCLPFFFYTQETYIFNLKPPGELTILDLSFLLLLLLLFLCLSSSVGCHMCSPR